MERQASFSGKSHDFELDSEVAEREQYGDLDMIEHEAKAGSNLKTFLAFMVLVTLTILSAATCSYLVWHLNGWIAFYCLLMLFIGFLFIDVLLTRTMYCFFIACFLWCKQRREHLKMKRYLEQILLQRQMQALNENPDQFANKRRGLMSEIHPDDSDYQKAKKLVH